MNSNSPIPRFLGLTLSIAPWVFVTACAAAKPPVASPPTRPGVAATQPMAPSMQPGEPTRGTIAISDEIRAACGIATADAFFDFDSATLESMDIQPLDAVARCFSTGPLAGRPMRLIGHADPRGPSEYNMALGQRRADSVDDYLGQRHLPRSQIATTSRGALDATGKNETGWAHDRRVDVQLGS